MRGEVVHAQLCAQTADRRSDRPADNEGRVQHGAGCPDVRAGRTGSTATRGGVVAPRMYV